MQLPDNSSEPEKGLEAPHELIAALKELRPPEVFIPRTIDEAVLRAARKHLSPAAAPARAWRFVPWLAGAATAGVLLVSVLLPERRVPEPPIIARHDINEDGVVDVLDALALARELKTGPVQGRDLNNDGQVDQGDVEVIVQSAVRLDSGGSS